MDLLDKRTLIDRKWRDLGGHDSAIGDPVSDGEDAWDAGACQHFRWGSIYWHPDPAIGAHEVHGGIRDKWWALGEQGVHLGYPTSDEHDAWDGGRVTHFQWGSIYWHPDPSIGAHEVHGGIRDKWWALGEQGVHLGFPTSDEHDAWDGGRVSHFQWGSIYWHPDPAIGAHEVHGGIRDKWWALGEQGVHLGFPTSDEHDAWDGGRVSHFQRGSIYWHPDPAIGAHEVHGGIRDKWWALGEQGVHLGFPTSDEHDGRRGERLSTFQWGSIHWRMGLDPIVMYAAWCAGGQHLQARLRFQPNSSREFYCRDHPRPRYTAWCAGGGHQVEGLSREPEASREFFCPKHPRPRVPRSPGPQFAPSSSGLGLTFREDPRGRLTSSSRSIGDLTFHEDRSGRSTGHSKRVPGMNLTFHYGKDGKLRGTSERIPGLGLTFNKDRSGKLKSTTDSRGFRSSPMGRLKGSSKRF